MPSQDQSSNLAAGFVAVQPAFQSAFENPGAVTWAVPAPIGDLAWLCRLPSTFPLPEAETSGVRFIPIEDLQRIITDHWRAVESRLGRFTPAELYITQAVLRGPNGTAVAVRLVRLSKSGRVSFYHPR